MSPRFSPRKAAHGLSFLSAMLCLPLACLLFLNAAAQSQQAAAPDEDAAAGQLQVVNSEGVVRGRCPLKHTDVRAQVSGLLSRVTVTQEFLNTFPEKIEAVYVFPLPQAAAVDDMTMRVGERTVRGKVLRREQAQAVYEAARAGGQVAALLDQQRPNIFTQSVANIMPGERVLVTISYVETLKYEAGTYEFSFPTVVGPRYVPGSPRGQTPQGTGAAPDSDRVPDASRIAPPTMPKGTRAGHDISVEVKLDAGLPFDGLKSDSHEIEVERAGPSAARVRLKKLTAIPNRDFVLRWDVAGERVADALLTHRGPRGGFFTLILQPPDRVREEDLTPKELVFVLDTSGSMSGFPIEKAKEVVRLALGGLNPQDTFNLITFSGDTAILFPDPVPATPENVAKAQAFLESRQGSGGTEMMKAVRAALDPSDSQAHVRVVCFLTDGYVGNDQEIIGEVRKHPNARVFSFGIGRSANRFLLDQMAEHGRGEVEYVSLRDDGSAAARRFYERVRRPLLTDISIDWGGLPVSEVYPERIPDLFAARPVVISGRYAGAAQGKVRLRGRMAGRPFEREIDVRLPESQPDNEVLASLWARRRVADLMGESYEAAQRGQLRIDINEAVTQLGLDYGLLTPYTSFVAVEEVFVTDGGQPRRVEVPVELPSGMAGTQGGSNQNRFVAEFGVGKRWVGRDHSYIITPNSPPAGTVNTTANPPAPAASPAPPAAGAPSEELKLSVSRTYAHVTPNAFERRALDGVLHPSLRALVERLKTKDSKPSEAEAKFVRDGKAEVQIWLREKTPEVLAQLKELGFELLLDPQTAKLVIGRLPVEKLAALAELKAVRYVAPQ